MNLTKPHSSVIECQRFLNTHILNNYSKELYV
jgi:hypothetical protein